MGFVGRWWEWIVWVCREENVCVISGEDGDCEWIGVWREENVW